MALPFPQASEFPPGKDIGLYTFEFNDIPLDELETVKCTITMFQEANLLAEFKIPLEVIEIVHLCCLNYLTFNYLLLSVSYMKWKNFIWHFFFDFVGDVSMDAKCEEELQTCDIS